MHAAVLVRGACSRGDLAAAASGLCLLTGCRRRRSRIGCVGRLTLQQRHRRAQRCRAVVGHQALDEGCTGQFDFGSPQYWEEHYASENGEMFDWLGNYALFRDHVLRATAGNKSSAIVDLGCGTSRLLEELHDEGYTNLVGVDISNVAVDAMRRRNLAARPSIRWLQADALDLGGALPDASVDIVIDKTTMDAVSCAPGYWNQNLARIVAEVFRVLREGGTYLVVSDSFIPQTACGFPHVAFNVRVDEVDNAIDDSGGQSQLSVTYVFSAVKRAGADLASLEDALEIAATMDADVSAGAEEMDDEAEFAMEMPPGMHVY